MKVFISQPMSGLTNDEILDVRERAISCMKNSYILDGKNFEIIDSFISNAPDGTKPLYLLGKALEKLSTADVCVFVDGWEKSRGCIIEHECCIQYDIKRAYIYL